MNINHKVAISLIFGVFAWLASCNNHEPLPYYGPRTSEGESIDGKGEPDTVYHSIPAFEFINQLGSTVSDKDLANQIYVADFIFTRCKTICIKMTNHLEKVQDEFKDIDLVKIISFSVDPERDSVPVLADYAREAHALNEKWNFVTGNKKEIYDLARNGFFVTATKGDGGTDDFIHSGFLILVDKDKHIRGYYDGTVEKEVNRLIDDIHLLLTHVTQ